MDMSLTLRGGTLIDGTGGDPLERAAISVEGERIRAVGGSGGTAVGEVLDLDGLTVLPGLIDAHSHFGLIAFEDLGRMPLAVQAAHIFRNCELALMAGFTTTADKGGIDGGVVRAIQAGLARGPRIYPSGPIIAQTGGHGDLAPGCLAHSFHWNGAAGLTQLCTIADGPEAVRQAAREHFRRGATQLKLCISGGVVSLSDRMEDTQFTVAELRAAVEEAQARETYVAVHAHNLRAMRNGLEAGVQCFEHATFLDQETAVLMAEQGAGIIPTLAVTRLLAEHWQEWGVPEAAVPRIEGCEQAMSDAVKIAHDAGVLVGSGSDLLGTGQNRRGLELVLKAQILGPMEAIVSATATTATIMRLEAEIGRVVSGLRADLIAVDGDPLSEPELFDDPGRVVFVMKDGLVEKDQR